MDKKKNLSQNAISLHDIVLLLNKRKILYIYIYSVKDAVSYCFVEIQLSISNNYLYILL